MMQQLLGYQQQYGVATGWMQPPVTQAPTKGSAFEAIFQSRPDLQAQKEQKYADWSVTRYMQHWWEGSGERNEDRRWTDPATGKEWVVTKDQTIIEFAISRGYIDPGPNPRDDYGMSLTGPSRAPLKGNETEEEIARLNEEYAPPWEKYAKPEREPTLAREEFEAGLEQWREEQLRLQGFTDAQIKQIEETLKLNREKYEQDVIQSNRDFLRLQGLDEEDVRRWEVEQEQLKDLTAEEQRRWNLEWARDEGWNEELIRQFEEQQTYSYYVADQQQTQFELEQLRLAGVEEQRAREFQQTHQLALDEFNVGNEQWKAEFGLEQQRFDRETGQWTQEFGLEERKQTEEERYNRLQQELEMMGLLTQQQGPRDWLQYGALQRQGGQAGLGGQAQMPVWQQRLLEGTGFAPFEGGAAMPPLETGGWQQNLMNQPQQGLGAAPFQGGVPMPPEGVQFGPELGVAPPQAPWQQALTQQAMGFIQPHQISPQQWQNMMPSEREMLMGQVETPVQLGGWGMYPEDYLDRMLKSWPTGQAQGISSFQGW